MRRAFIAGSVLILLVLWEVLQLMQATPAPVSAVSPHTGPDALVGDWLLVGGGIDPTSTQISIAQDIALAQFRLGGPGTLLFGSGPATLVQQISERPDTLMGRLADLFDPRDRATAYLELPLAIDGPSDAETVLDLLADSSRSNDPRLVFIAGHGERGDAPGDSVVRLWGEWSLSTEDFANAIDGQPTILVLTTCFGGGFAEIVFDHASADESVVPGRCGLFASTWDREASGCDPNPARGHQNGYAMHFFHGLAGVDRSGNPASLDYDGDGAISLLEAHSYTRVAGRSFDVPSTTAERYLRLTAPKLPEPAEELAPLPPEPEEAIVITSLREELGLGAEEAREELSILDDTLRDMDESAALTEARVDRAYFALRIRLLERWPILDDPWHRDFQALMASDNQAIEYMLRESEWATEYEQAANEHAQEMAARDGLELRRARLLTLVRAEDTARLYQRLAVDENALATYRSIRACERSVVPIDRSH